MFFFKYLSHVLIMLAIFTLYVSVFHVFLCNLKSVLIFNAFAYKVTTNLITW